MLKSFILSIVSGVIGLGVSAFKQNSAEATSPQKTKKEEIEGFRARKFFPSDRTVEIITDENNSILNECKVEGMTENGTVYCARKVGQQRWEINLPRDVEDEILIVFASKDNYGFARRKIKIDKYRRKYSVNLSEIQNPGGSVN